jgi:Uma2 family endonuclease
MSAGAAKKLPERPATLADLLAIPEHERFHELIDGELIQKATPAYEHGRTQGRSFRSLGPFDRRPGGPPDRPGGWWIAIEVEVQIGDNVYRPDVVGWRRDRVPEEPKGSPVTILPDWICEVLSPSNASHDTVTKMRAYHRARVPHYWLLDPGEQTLMVLRYTPEGYLHVLSAVRGERVRAEPFDAIELQVGVFFGDDEE